MSDFSVPNAQPGPCAKCGGSGIYRWGTRINGKGGNEGPCFSCQGTGKQSARQIRRNNAYNRFKLQREGI